MKRQLKNLTIKDNFMFAAVMLDAENCKGFLERALQIKIDHVEVSTEKNIVYHPEYKGVRLDVYAKDEKNTRNCKGFLERALQIKIDHVEVSTEKNIVYHPEYKGVRLDVYAKDEKNTRYNVEMQVSSQSALGLRSRYYESQMDMEMLLSGCEYSELPNSYVIFICDFDPFGEKSGSQHGEKYCESYGV